jgi:hypothetical protein
MLHHQHKLVDTTMARIVSCCITITLHDPLLRTKEPIYATKFEVQAWQHFDLETSLQV